MKEALSNTHNGSDLATFLKRALFLIFLDSNCQSESHHKVTN